MKLTLDRKTREMCNYTMVISGSARSGTTILGKLLHSFKGVEYMFEPPTLTALFPLLDSIDSEQWKFIYEAFLYEEFLINAVSGRFINCNRGDDSSIFSVKNEADIAERLAGSCTKQQAEELVKSRRIAYKLPSIARFFPKLNALYPEHRLILATRKAPEVFNSVFRKGWFDDESLQYNNQIWPCYFVDGRKVPSWVAENDAENWLAMDELHRVAYYYLTANEPLGKFNDLIQVKYDELLANPHDVIFNLAQQLDLSFGEKTEELLTTIGRQNEKTDESILSGLGRSVRERVLACSDVS